MFICICNAVSDRAIEKAIEDGAHSYEEIAKQLNAGTNCGKCINNIKAMIYSKQPQTESKYNLNTPILYQPI